MEVIFKDGIKYLPHAYNDEKELESIIFEHVKDIFHKDSILLAKQKIKTRSGIGSIPDAFVLSIAEKKWYIVEVELAIHQPYKHIVPQVTSFTTAVNNPHSQRELLKAFHSEIKIDPLKKEIFEEKRITEVHEYISETMEYDPEIVIFIDEKNYELDETFEKLGYAVKIIPFKTYHHEDKGVEEHIHVFESLQSIERTIPPKGGKTLPQNRKSNYKGTEIIDLINAGYIIPDFIIYRKYKGEIFKAKILNDGRINILNDNTIVDSLSMAAHHLTGTQINGWIWWKFQDENGKELLIGELRKKYLQEVKQRV